MSTPETRDIAPSETDLDENEDSEAEEEEDEETKTTDVDEFEKVPHQAPSNRERAIEKASGAKKAIKSIGQKLTLDNRRMARLSNLTEYLMVSFITLAVLSIIAFGVHLAIAGLAVPIMVYVQVFIGSLISALGLFVLQIILEGGTEYLSRMR